MKPPDDLMYSGTDPDLAPGEAWEGDGCPGVAFNLDGRVVFIAEWEHGGAYGASRATAGDWSVAEYLIALVKKDRSK